MFVFASQQYTNSTSLDCNCHTKDHRSISQSPRCWLVRLSIFIDNRFVPTTLRQILYFFFNQMGLSNCNWYIRTWKSYLRRCPQLDSSDYWTSRCRCWECWYILRSAYHSRIQRAARQTPHVHGIHWRYVWDCFSRWSIVGWCFH